MAYDAATGIVTYRSKMHLGLKRNYQLMPGAEWLELLRRHIPDRYEHLVRYLTMLSLDLNHLAFKHPLPLSGTDGIDTQRTGALQPF